MEQGFSNATPATGAAEAAAEASAILAASEMPAPSRLVASGLQKTYGSRKVVQDVSLSVQSGEVVGLLGPNGAGKTTSFYMIVGLVRADAGEITIDGNSVEHMPIHRRARLGLSYLPQEASIFRKLSVEQNVRAVLELQHDDEGKPLALEVINERLDALLAVATHCTVHNTLDTQPDVSITLAANG